MQLEDAVGVLERGLEAFAKLPEADRKPAAAVLDELEQRSRVGRRPVPEPPANGLVLKTFTSHLERSPGDEIARAKKPFKSEVARDSVWLTETEWKSLVPSDLKKGFPHPVAQPIQDRLARFALWDNYRSGLEARPWRRDEVRSTKLTITVEEASADALRLALRGTVLIASDADIAIAKIGYHATLLGQLDFDRRQQRFTRFDVVSLADSWWFEPMNVPGQFAYMNDWVGRMVVGVAFELASPDTAFHRVPPRFLGNDYFGRGP